MLAKHGFGGGISIATDNHCLPASSSVPLEMKSILVELISGWGIFTDSGLSNSTVPATFRLIKPDFHRSNLRADGVGVC